MTPLWRNPEFIRNCRAQLRPRRLFLVASIIAALSLAIGYSLYQMYYGRPDWALTLFTIALYSQVFVLCLGGGFACMRSIAQEREQNTFDFQRVTQLSSLELALGKLFGAPAIAYFAALCILPATLVGAAVGGIPASRLAAALVILLLGSIAVHALMLLVSLGSTRTSAGFTGMAAIFLLFLLLMAAGSPQLSRTFLELGPLSPASAVEFAKTGTWNAPALPAGRSWHAFSTSVWTDLFFGIRLHHVPVLLVLYFTFILWCLVPLVRNLKRDPALLELYSPAQSVGLLAYLDVILVGFYRLHRFDIDVLPANFAYEHTLAEAFSFLLVANLFLLYFLGLALLRNREQARRRAHHRADGAFAWQDAAWPSVYVLAGAACAALLFLARFAHPGAITNDLNTNFAVFTCALLLATVLRDLCFLQWMNLRRSRRPLVLGVILLGVFYFCGGILLEMAKFTEPVKTAFSAIVAPWPLASAEASVQQACTLNPTPWFIGLAVQLALVVLFAVLHYKSTEDLRPAPIAAPASAQAVGD